MNTTKDNDQPLSLVYSSDSFRTNNPGIVFGVLIYKINYNYLPKASTTNTNLAEENILQNPILLSRQGNGNSGTAVNSSISQTSINTTQ
jgi:dolichyl-diphosphooligosaccharide--protein glycosyltransferase